MRTMRPMRSLGVRVVVCAIAAAGCQAVFGIHGSTLTDGGLGQPCNEDSSNSSSMSRCAESNVCVMNQCRKPCTTDLECGNGERCLPTDSHTNCNPTCPGGCVPSTGAACNPKNPCGESEMFIGAGMVGGCGKGDSNGNCTCKGGTVCAQDGQCRSPCSTNTMSGFQCANGQSCFTDPTACRNQMGMGGECSGACYGSPPHDTPLGGDGGGTGATTTFYDGSSGNAFAVVATDNGIYFTVPTGNVGLFGCPLDNSCTSPQKTTNGKAPALLAALGHTLAFTNQGMNEIGVCINTAPGMCTFQSFTDMSGTPNGVAIRNDMTISWRDDPGMVYAANGADKLPNPSASGPGGLAALEQYLYWTAGGRVFACPTPLSTCTTPMMVANASAGSSITGNNVRAFWTANNAIHTSPLGSQMTMPWVTTTSMPVAVIYDAFSSNLYWTESDGSVKRTSSTQPQSTVTTVASGSGSAQFGGSIAVTNLHVYWVANGKILRAPK